MAIEDTSGLGVATVMKQLNKVKVKEGRRKSAQTSR